MDPVGPTSAGSAAGSDIAAGRRLGHVPALDGVRAFAVLLVVGLHAGYAYFPSHSQELLSGGFLGVDVFFVLSGFLITSILVEEHSRTGGLSFRRFYWRRAYRLLPAVTVLGVVHLAYVIAVGDPLRPELRSLGTMALYVNNWAQARGWEMRPDLEHAWSLSIEEQFYLLWPLAVIGLLALRGRGRIIGTVAGVACAAALWRWWLWDSSAEAIGFRQAYFRTDARIDNLLIGALAALAWRWGWVPAQAARAAAAVGLPGLVGLSLYFDRSNGDLLMAGGLSLAALLAAGLILGAASGSSPYQVVLTWPPMVLLGRVSYGVYLWHLPIFRAVHRHLDALPALGELAVALLLTAAAVTASWRLVEQPMLARKTRRHPTAAAGVPVPAPD